MSHLGKDHVYENTSNLGTFRLELPEFEGPDAGAQEQAYIKTRFNNWITRRMAEEAAKKAAEDKKKWGA